MQRISLSDKKAWIRIVEAVAAIMLLSSVILILSFRNSEKNDISSTIYSVEHAILTEASENETIRTAVLANDAQQVNDFVKSRMPVGISFKIAICSPSEVCSTDNIPNRDVYVDDVVISSTLQQYSPRKLALFVWLE